MAHTEIPDETVDAFLRTDYRFGEEGKSVTLRVNQCANELFDWYALSGTNCGVFITACNPFSIPQNPETNEAAHKRLEEHLRKISDLVVEGEGGDVSGDWVEKSFMAFGVDLDAAKAVGIQYRQNAIVWVGPDAKPQLILLR